MGIYLVTGCAGFIGSHLCDRLVAEGHSVVGIDNFDPFYDRSIKERNISKLITTDQFRLIESDICDNSTWEALENNVFDCVFHLAAKAGVRPSIQNPEEYIRTNVLGTQKLLDWMVTSSNKRLIFASSSSIYGNNDKVPFSENDNVDYPISPYAFTKKSCELMIHTYSHLYDINAVCLRFFTVYGPRQRPDLAIHKFFNAIYNHEEITIFGDGSSSRDYTYIEDIIDGVVSSKKFSEEKESGFTIINLGGDSPITLKRLIEEIETVTNKKTLKRILPMQLGDVNRTYAAIEKAKKILKFNPKNSIYDGLSKFNTWYLNEYVNEKTL